MACALEERKGGKHPRNRITRKIIAVRVYTMCSLCRKRRRANKKYYSGSCVASAAERARKRKVLSSCRRRRRRRRHKTNSSRQFGDTVVRRRKDINIHKRFFIIFFFFLKFHHHRRSSCVFYYWRVDIARGPWPRENRRRRHHRTFGIFDSISIIRPMVQYARAGTDFDVNDCCTHETYTLVEFFSFFFSSSSRLFTWYQSSAFAR